MTLTISNIDDITKRVDKNTEKEATKLQYSEQKIKQQKTQFFSILAQQLKNQDPTNPVDTNQMVGQMVALSGLEQQLYSNQYLEKIEHTLRHQEHVQAANNIGKMVEYKGNNFKYQGEPVELKYEFDNAVNNAKLNILNSNRDVIFSEDITRTKGMQHFNWQGMDWRGGPAPKGTYSFEVLGDYKDKNIVASPITKGVVESVVSNPAGEISYVINGQEIKPELIQKFNAPAA